MKFNINRAMFLEALRYAPEFMDRGQTSSPTTMGMIEVDSESGVVRVKATSIDHGGGYIGTVIADVQEGGAVLINLGLLLSYLNTLTASSLTFELYNDGKLHLNAKGVRTSFGVVPSHVYPQVYSTDDFPFKMGGGDLLEILSYSNPIAVKDRVDLRWHSLGLVFDNGRLSSYVTNMYRYGVIQVATSFERLSKSMHVLAPSDVTKVIAKAIKQEDVIEFHLPRGKDGEWDYERRSRDRFAIRIKNEDIEIVISMVLPAGQDMIHPFSEAVHPEGLIHFIENGSDSQKSIGSFVVESKHLAQIVHRVGVIYDDAEGYGIIIHNQEAVSEGAVIALNVYIADSVNTSDNAMFVRAETAMEGWEISVSYHHLQRLGWLTARFEHLMVRLYPKHMVFIPILPEDIATRYYILYDAMLMTKRKRPSEFQKFSVPEDEKGKKV